MANVEVSGAQDTIFALEATARFMAVASDAGGTVLSGKSFTWSSSVPAVATVDSEGVVTAQKNGNAMIRAEADGVTGEAAVTVWQQPATATVTPERHTLTLPGDTARFTARTFDANGYELEVGPTITWASTHPEVATVDDDGLATAVGSGTATITAYAGAASGGATLLVVVPWTITLFSSRTALTAIADTVQMRAEVRDSSGTLVDATVVWSSTTPAVATVSETGLVTAITNGTTDVRASLVGLTAGIAIAVQQQVAQVVAEPDSAVLRVTPGSPSVQLSAAVYDANGYLLDPQPASTWSTLDAAVATVSVSGLVSPAAYGAGRIVAMLPAAGDTAIVYVVPAVRHLSSTGYHTCVTTDLDEVLCWGRNSEGQVGAGAPAAVLQPTGTASELALAQASAGWFHTGALAKDGAVLRWGPDVVQVGTDVETSFVSVGAMGRQTVLGLGMDGYAYQLEDSASAVWPYDLFIELQAGFLHSCGLTIVGTPHCWGYDEYGELGTDSGFVGQFVALTVGLYHTCGLTASGEAYCWGANADGQLGTGTRSRSRLPVAVQGGLQFTALQAGAYHTCGITDEGEGYCWGWNGHGQLGDGTTVDRTVPVSVSGNLTFSRLASGVAHTCAEATDGRVWCWGLGSAGQLGDGRGEETWTPVAIVFAAPAGAAAVVARAQFGSRARDAFIDEPRIREAIELEARGRALCAARARGETISDLALAHVWQCR